MFEGNAPLFTFSTALDTVLFWVKVPGNWSHTSQCIPRIPHHASPCVLDEVDCTLGRETHHAEQDQTFKDAQRMKSDDTREREPTQSALILTASTSASPNTPNKIHKRNRYVAQ